VPIQIASLFAKIGADTSGLNKGLREADAAIGRTEKNTMSMAASMGALSASFAAVGAAGKLIWETGKQGAMIQRAENSFNALSGSAEQAATNLELLRDVTRNSKSDFELMQGAANLMALGLADDAAQLGGIMKNVEALGSRFGGTMQIFQLMMSNQSLMRIDSFGIGVEEATKRIDEFKKAGMSAEDAFNTAILELMEEKYVSLGGAIEDDALAYEQLEAVIKNTTDAIKVQVSTAISPAIKRYVDFLAIVKENDWSLIGFASTIRLVTYELTENERFAASLGVGWKLFTGQFGSAFKEMQKLPPSIHEISVKEEQSGNSARGAADKIKKLNDEREREIEILQRMAGAHHGLISYIDKSIKLTGNSAIAWGQYEKAIAGAQAEQDRLLNKENIKRAEDMAYNVLQVGQAWAGVQLAMTGPVKNENEQYNDSLQRSTDRMAELQIEIDKLERGHGRLIETKKEEAASENELALIVAKRSDAEYRLMVELAKDDKDENATVMAQMRVNIDKYNEALNVTVDTTQKYVDNTKRISELKKEYDEVAKGVDALGDAHDEATKRILFNMLLQRVAMSEGGDTSEAQTAAMELANKLGIVDQATLDWWKTFDGYVDAVDLGMRTMEDAIELGGNAILRNSEISDEVMPVMFKQAEENTRQWLLYWEAVGGVAASLENMPTDTYTIIHIKQIWDKTPLTVQEQLQLANPEDFPNGAPTVPPTIPGGTDTGNGGGAASSSWSGNININGAGDPSAVASAVIQKLADRGIVRAGGYR